MKARNQLVINKNVNTPHLLLTICRTEIMKQSTERMAPEAAKLMHTIGRRGSSSVHASLAGKIKHRGIVTIEPMIDKVSDKDGHAITPRYDEQRMPNVTATCKGVDASDAFLPNKVMTTPLVGRMSMGVFSMIKNAKST